MAEVQLEPGTLFADRYRILRLLGAGGMGTVYAAKQIGLDRTVALKVMSPKYAADQQTVERFRREGRAASKARHPNIVDVFDLGESQGHWFLAMELLDGIDLGDALALKKFYEPAEAAPILDQLLQALEAAHGLGLVHRDLKPRNVFLARTSAGDISVKLLDFGVVKLLDDKAARLTPVGIGFGTPEYMSPEQCTGQTVDARADLYAVGCLAYRLICGVCPFQGNSPAERLQAQVYKPHKPPSQERPSVPDGPAVDKFIARALEKNPNKRFQTAAEMRAGLQELAIGSGIVNLATTPVRIAMATDLNRTLPSQPSELPSTPGWGMPEPGSAKMRIPATREPLTRPIPEPSPGAVGGRAPAASAMPIVIAAVAGGIVAAAVTYFLLR